MATLTHRKPESADTPRDSSFAQKNDRQGLTFVFRGLTLRLAKQQWSLRTTVLLATRGKIPRQTSGKKLGGVYSLCQVAVKSWTSIWPRMKYRRPARIPSQRSWSRLTESSALRFRIGSIGSRVQGSKFIKSFLSVCRKMSTWHRLVKHATQWALSRDSLTCSYL